MGYSGAAMTILLSNGFISLVNHVNASNQQVSKSFLKNENRKLMLFFLFSSIFLRP